mmetsp:Transcript_3865/g.11182  ORF Transcript_3865/g.11182 Transcript_3865/m.11182 type:complete len:276 (+) Transcript_3865:589-1416(+)
MLAGSATRRSGGAVLAVGVGELGIHHVGVGRPRGGAAARSGPLGTGAGTRGASISARLAVHGLTHGHGLLLQGLLRRLDGGEVLALEGGAEVLHLGLHLALHIIGDLALELLQLLLGLVHEAVSRVADVNLLALLFVLLGELLGLRNHLVYLIAGQSGCASNLDVGLAAAALVGGGHGQDAVGVNVELDLDLGHAAGRGGDAVQPEVTQRLVVLHELTLALQHVDLHGGLPVGGCAEGLRLGGGQSGVAGDKLGHHTAQGLQTQGQRGDVQQHDV